MKKHTNKLIGTYRKSISDSAKIDLQSIAVLTQILAFASRMYPRLRAEDKTPNGDGYVEITNEDNRVIGVIEVQVKTIGNRKNRISCPSYLVDHAKHSLMPFFLIGVDREKKIAYWRQLSETMPEYKESQGTFTVAFSDDELIDGTNKFCEPWTRIAADRANLPNELNELQHALLRC